MKKIILSLIFLLNLYSTYAQSSDRHFQIQINTTRLTGDFERIGQLHNEALDYVLSRLSRVTNLDRVSFTQQFKTYMEEFLISKGVNSNFNFDGNYEQFSTASDAEILCGTTGTLSEAAKTLICKIEENIKAYTDEKISSSLFIANVDQYEKDALSLQVIGEQNICGNAAAISKYSMQYWELNYDHYKQTFSTLFKPIQPKTSGPNLGIINNSLSEKPLKIRWGLVGLSDVVGAVRWGIVGFTAAGGPAGAIACGFAGAAGHSCASIIGQSLF